MQPEQLLTRAVYAKGAAKEKNQLARFTFALSGKEQTTLYLAAGSTFLGKVNGKFAFYGPMRAEHGAALCHEYDLTRFLTENENLLEIFITAYNINSYYIVDEPAFFSAAVVRGGKTVATEHDFTAYREPQKVQKVQRYSFQRNFVEVYDLRKASVLSETEEVPLPRLKTVNLTAPDYGVLACSAIERGAAEERDGLYPYAIPEYARVGGTCKGYPENELEVNLLNEINRLYYRKKTENDAAPYRYTLYDVGKNKTGFINFTVEAEEDVIVYVTFDEILCEEEKSDPAKRNTVDPDVLRLSPMHTDPVNGAKVIFPKGRHEFTLMEPYTMRYLKLTVKGKCAVSDVYLRTYENPDAYKMQMRTGDEKLDAVVTAAASTFSQNAVDVLTDCPSRERAGWLCDSFFSGAAETFLTGENKVEKHFLTTILHHNQSEIGYLPKGVFPMCYPADFPSKQYIPNWDMWLVLELASYLKRTGDRALIDEFREKIYDLLHFFAGFENRDGLLERLDGWVFVEWSRCNDLVQDVNYPSNMAYAGVLSAAGELYGDEALKKKAQAVLAEVEKQSFNGEFYRDRAIRKEGVLTVTEDVTETCQYYAMFFGLVTKEKHADLFDTMVRRFGPERDDKATYPAVWRSNAFIGNYLRLEVLLSYGLYEEALKDSAEFFYKMALRTGSLWEHDNPGASCCHGFASKAAAYIAQAYFGYLGCGKFGDRFIGKEGSASFPYHGKTYCVTISGGKREITVL